MRDRQFFENLESEVLAPYAVKSSQTKGRQFEEPADLWRTCFQRDRDRIIHSKAFRRLKHKTQVFIIFEGDHYRTRLTHTLEVTQIARHIGRILGLNEDLIETVALAHDLGHTPFGHAGEAILDELCEGVGGFEHNIQSRRIVEKLETKYPDFSGLNLSLEVLDGLMKHFTPFDNPGGLLDHELVHPTLEAQVVNVSDQLAYVTHDVDDGLASGILSFGHMAAQVSLWEEASDWNRQHYKVHSEEQLRFLNVRYLVNILIMDVVNASSERLKKMNIHTLEQALSSAILLVDFSDDMVKRVKELREYLYQQFYLDERVKRMSSKGKRFIKEMYTFFKKNPDRLPPDFMENVDKNEPMERIIADYISQMTDNFAIEEHERLFRF